MGSLRTDVEDSHQKKRGKTRLEGIQREGSQCLERIEAADRRFALVVLQAAILGVLLPVEHKWALQGFEHSQRGKPGRRRDTWRV